jgi:hypothetical protein
MVRILQHIGIVLLLAFSVSCTPNKHFFKKSRGKWVTKKSYNAQDVLVLNNYGIYNSINEELLIPNKEPFPVNKDSLLLVFDKSLNRIGLKNISIEYTNNIIDSALYLQTAVRIRHFDEIYIDSLAESSPGKIKIVPVVYAHNQYTFAASFSSGGLFSSNGWFFVTYLSLFVFVIKEDEIIYSRQIQFASDQVWANSKNEILAVPPLAAVRQEHWDELVRLAMKDYIKRMK